MNKKLEQIKHFFRMIGYIFTTMWKVLRDKRTWIAIAFILWTYLISWFNSNYYTQSPVKTWQPMIMKRSIPKKTAQAMKPETVVAKDSIQKPKIQTEEELVKSMPHGDELWNIYMLESTRGKNDGCKKEGKWGGFGVMSAGTPACYESFAKAVERASYWYEKIRKDNDLATSTCIWNLGTKVNNCMYYQKYMSL